MRSLHTLACVALCLALMVGSAMGEDLYKTLGVSRSASQREIKKGYHKMSMKYHPDKNDTPEAMEKFTQATRAYEILSDDELKPIYDRQGMPGIERKEKQGQNQGGGHPFGGMFGNMFGQQMQQKGQQQKQRGAPITLHVPVSLEDAYSGVSRHVDVLKRVICPGCGGTGAHSHSDVKTCTRCSGTGQVTERRQLGPGIVQTVNQPCS
ncbi:hypothetical protein KIPB_003956, partial [Kipferlia bialata]|eukprot:g3956.t1